MADYGNHRIQVFHLNGNYIKIIGGGQLSSPAGICMDREGRIIVSEQGDRISKLVTKLAWVLIGWLFVLFFFEIKELHGHSVPSNTSFFLFFLFFIISRVRKKEEEKRL